MSQKPTSSQMLATWGLRKMVSLPVFQIILMVAFKVHAADSPAFFKICCEFPKNSVEFSVWKICPRQLEP